MMTHIPTTNLKEQNMMTVAAKSDQIQEEEQSDVVISVNHIAKKFCRNLKRSMAYGIADLSKNLFGIKPETSKLRQAEFWALNDVNFELRKGETLGIIGANGSGKTTLLRLLSGIFPPDKGEIMVKGRIGTLVAIGAGFHPHMTGRENIYLNGTILGMDKQEIQKKFERITGFAEIDEFLDAPVSTYSSGMRVRLGFSIAIHCEPDILLVDEVLSVGDLSFANKSLQRMHEYRAKANAVIFVSHRMEHVRVLCNRLILIDKGRMIYSGDTEQGIIEYEKRAMDGRLNMLGAGETKEDRKVISTLEGYQDQRITIKDIGIFSADGKQTHEIGQHEPLHIYGKFVVSDDIDSLFFALGVHNEHFSTCIIRVVSSDGDKMITDHIKKGEYCLHIVVKEHSLASGLYFPQITIRNANSNERYARARSVKPFKITTNQNILEERGLINVDEVWNLEHIL